MSGRTSVYLWFGVDDVLLYVGITNHLLRRTGDHARAKAWFDDVVRCEVEHHDTRAAALDREAEIIRTRRPLHNVVHNRPGPLVVPAPDTHRRRKGDVELFTGWLFRRRHDETDVARLALRLRNSGAFRWHPGRGRGGVIRPLTFFLEELRALGGTPHDESVLTEAWTQWEEQQNALGWDPRDRASRDAPTESLG